MSAMRPLQIVTGALPQTRFIDVTDPNLDPYESIADTSEHPSLALDVRYLQEKQFEVLCVESGSVAPLWIWVELAADTDAHDIGLGAVEHNLWAAIGGGGGEVAPIAPEIVVRVGSDTGQVVMLPWTAHSIFARLVVQCPAWTTGAWGVQVRFSGK